MLVNTDEAVEELAHGSMDLDDSEHCQGPATDAEVDSAPHASFYFYARSKVSRDTKRDMHFVYLVETCHLFLST